MKDFMEHREISYKNACLVNVKYWIDWKMLKIINSEIKLYTYMFKGCVHYTFASFFFKSKREHLGN